MPHGCTRYNVYCILFVVQLVSIADRIGLLIQLQWVRIRCRTCVRYGPLVIIAPLVPVKPLPNEHVMTTLK